MNIINLECIKLCNISVPRDYLQASTILTMPNSLLVFPSMFAFLSSCLRVVGVGSLWSVNNFSYLFISLASLSNNRKQEISSSPCSKSMSAFFYQLFNSELFFCFLWKAYIHVKPFEVSGQSGIFFSPLIYRCQLHFHACADILATLQWLLLTALVDTLSVHSHDSLLKVFILEN